MKKLLLILLLWPYSTLADFVIVSVDTQVQTIEWDKVTKDISGNPLDIVGYRIYESKKSGVYSDLPIIDTQGFQAFLFLPPGRHFVVGTSYTKDAESPYSNELTFVVKPSHISTMPKGLKLGAYETYLDTLRATVVAGSLCLSNDFGVGSADPKH